MSTSPIRIPITTTDEFSAGFAAAQARVRQFEAQSGAAGEAMKRSFGEARGSVALLNEELGVGLSRHLRAVLATSQLIGPALELAFPIVAAVGFFEVIDKIAHKLADFYYDADGIKQLGEDIKTTTEYLVKLSGEVDHLNQQTSEVGVSAQQKWATALDAATKKLAEQNERTRRLSDTIYALEHGQQNAFGNTEVAGKTAADIPKLKEFYSRAVADAAKFYAEQQNAQAELNTAQRGGMDEYNTSLSEAAKRVQEIRNRWIEAMQAASGATNRLLDKGNPFKEQLNAIDEQVQKWQEIAGQQSGINAIANNYLGQLNKQRDSVLQQQQAWESMFTNALKFNQFLPAQKTPVLIGDDDSQKSLERWKGIQGWIDATETSAEKLADEIKNLNDLFGSDKGEVYHRALNQIKDKYDETRHAVEKFGEAAGQALAQGVLMGRSWKDILDSLVIAVGQLIVKMYVLKALQASSFGSSGFGSFITAIVSGFAGKAGGGDVSGGTPYMVGENGPELFMPNTSGTIVPNGKWGGGHTVYQDFRGAVVTDDLLRRADGAAMMSIAQQRAVAQAVGIVRENGLRGRV